MRSAVVAFLLSGVLAACASPAGNSPPVPLQIGRSHGSGIHGQTITSSFISITDIGTFPGYSQAAVASGINDDGVAVGYVCCSNNPFNPATPYKLAVKFSSGKLETLPGISGYSSAQANAINTVGEIVGNVCFPDAPSTINFSCVATSWDSSGIHKIGSSKWNQSDALAVDNVGLSVGTARLTFSSGPDAAVRFEAGGQVNLHYYAQALGINDNGTVVGFDEIRQRAVIFNGLHAGISLGTLGGAFSIAYAINHYGKIVGVSATNQLHNGSPVAHPFLYEGGKMIDLGLPPGAYFGQARAINNRGDVVGSDENGAFLFRSCNDHIIDLNSLLPPNSGWHLDVATGVNDWLTIVGSGTHNGAIKGFVLKLRSINA